MWREWLSYPHWVYVVRYRWLGYLHRAIYGWAPIDTWKFDTFLASVLAPALRHMAENGHGYPAWVLDEYPSLTGRGGKVDQDRAMEVWANWLHEKAAWFEWYAKDDIGITPGMSDEEKVVVLDYYEYKMDRFKNTVLLDFITHFDSLWD